MTLPMNPDVFKIFKDLELKAVGLDQTTNKEQEGYFCAFRSIGLPIRNEDYENPYSPVGGNLKGDIPPPADPKTAPKTGSDAVDTQQAFAANIAKNQQNFLSTFALCDSKLQMNGEWNVMPGASKLSDTWYALITGATSIGSTMVPTAAQEAALDAARAQLGDESGNITPMYQNYKHYESIYRDKLRAYQRAYADAISDPFKLQAFPRDRTYQDDIGEAMDDWMGLGHKTQIETAINILASQGMDPANVLIARSKKAFQNALLAFPGYGEIPYIAFNPQSWCDADNDDGWNVYSETDFQSKSNYTASQTSFGGGVDVHVGLWSGGAQFEHANTQANANAEVKNLRINFSYAIVDIDRPWLDTSLLNLSTWALFGDYRKNTISDGTMGQVKPTDGTEPEFMPSVVTSLILIKDVHIFWDDWKDQWAAHTASNSASASFGCCFVTAKANYSHAQQSRSFEVDDSGKDLYIPGIQLVGYVSQIMPASPQRDGKEVATSASTPAASS